ncbi:MAG: NADH-quinone oxidoreductase subunit NuoE, partial [Rhizobiaceae bacterium]
MTVRRLAEDKVQPASFAFNKANAAWAKATVKKYPDGRQASAVIPLLMRAQEQEGWVSRAAIEQVAAMLAMPNIRVLEVATFYTQFQLAPVGTRAHVQVCGTTPCMLRGSEELIGVCRARIHHDPFHTNAAGTLSWEEVECLGACVNAPMVMIGKDTYEDLTPERLTEIIDAFEAGKGDGVKPGPQNGRWFSEPLTGRTALRDEKIFFKAGRARAAKAAKAEPAKA